MRSSFVSWFLLSTAISLAPATAAPGLVHEDASRSDASSGAATEGICPGDPDHDADGDGVCGNVDNCPAAPNPNQADSDGDGFGDVCDNCPLFVNPNQANGDGDPFGDVCDNCPTIFNPDQIDDDGNGFGNACNVVPVDGLYYIGVTEVTNAGYATFLNAVAAADPKGLFNTLMTTDVHGGILRSGVSGSYTYAVKTNMGKKPVNYVSWLDAARYANWLHNGRPSGPQGSATTEQGAYDLTVANPGTAATRRPGASWFLPTEAEWVRAAYHDSFYGWDWTYPTRSDGQPTQATANAAGDISNPGPNVANYGSLASRPTTVASAGPASSSPYGTFDQGGNVAEWNETLVAGSRVVRGGNYVDGAGPLRSDTRVTVNPTTEERKTGFRVASNICPGNTCDDMLLLFQTHDQIAWQQEQGVDAWNVYQGDLDVLRSTGIYTQAPGSNPLAGQYCGLTATWLYDSQNPAGSEVVFTLVTSVRSGVEGSLGRDSAGNERANTSPCP